MKQNLLMSSIKSFRPCVVLLLLAALCFMLSGAIASTLPAGKAYPEFHIGVTGIWAELTADGVLTVTQITSGSLADGKFQAGDVLLAVNGNSLEIQDPRPVLGEAINTAEGTDGTMVFKVKRNTTEMHVTIMLTTIGSYSVTWPLDCQKSQTIIEETAEFIIKVGPRQGYTGAIDGLFLLSTGIPKYIQAAETWANYFATGTCGSHTWNNGYIGLFLGEYYLATGDTAVLPTIKALCDNATERQYYGGWNHWNDAGPGYVQGGLMNPAGLQVLTTLILARECGVEFDESTYDKALTYFYRYAGHGAVAYGNHPPEGMGSNGKNGMLACALNLLPDQKFQDATQILALAETDTYYDNEGGHGSHFGNVMWRGIAGTLVPPAKQQNYRRHMDALMWYYELCRLPQGGFWMLPQPNGGSRRGIGSAPNYSAGMVGLTYTAPLKTLRITGKPRTIYSLEHKPTTVEESLPYTDFQKNNFVDGGDDGGMDPHEIMAASDNNATPIEWCWKMMHHYQPEIRLQAAVAMGDKGSPAVPYILNALKSDDARLRQAGLNAIHGIYQWWFYRISSSNGIRQEDVTEQFLPYILNPLNDPDAAMWEKVSALWALGKADAPTVIDNVSLIREHLKHDDWWVRVAAWAAAKPLMADENRARIVLDDLMECFANELIVHPYRSMMGHLKTMHMQHESLRLEIIEGMANAAKELEVIEGYKINVYINKIYEPLRYINMSQHPEHVVTMLGPIQHICKTMRGQQCAWLLTGAGWGNIGLVECVNKMGKDAAPVVATIKAIIPDIEIAATGSQADMINEALDAARACVATYEAAYGSLPEAITLVGPADGDTLDAGGAVFSCQVSQNADNYKLLMGPDPYCMNPYDIQYIISNTVNPPEDVITLLPYANTYWTIKAENLVGSIFADPICIKAPSPVNPITNSYGREYLDLISNELVWENQISETVTEYCFKLKVKNIYLQDVENVTVEISSVPDNITVIDNELSFTSLPGGQEVLSDDTFIIRIDHTASTDQNDIVWAMGFVPDTTPPTPDPMKWESVPEDTGNNSIIMTASEATDPCGVEYYFTCTAGGGDDSGWQDSRVYEDTNLTPGVVYTYTVTARDKSPNQNITAPSTVESAMPYYVPPAVLTAYYDFEPDSPLDDPAGDFADDLYGYNATWSVDVPAATGSTRSASFDGNTALYTNAYSTDLGPDPNAYTIMFWIKARDADQENNNTRLMTTRTKPDGSGASNPAWQVEGFGNNGSNGTRMDMRANNGTDLLFTPDAKSGSIGALANTGQETVWHHVAFVFANSGHPDNDGAYAETYFDGVSAGITGRSGNNDLAASWDGFNIANPDGQLIIGSTGETGSSRDFTGLLDDVALFSGIVSAKDIAAIADGTLSPESFLPKADLTAFAKFARNWLRSNCSEANQWCEGSDLNGDNSVDLSDLAEFAADWLQ